MVQAELLGGSPPTPDTTQSLAATVFKLVSILFLLKDWALEQKIFSRCFGMSSFAFSSRRYDFYGVECLKRLRGLSRTLSTAQAHTLHNPCWQVMPTAEDGDDLIAVNTPGATPVCPAIVQSYDYS
jgi:hypothetical protein